MTPWIRRAGVLLILLGLAGLFLTGAAAERARAALEDELIRIHIVAASDSPEDQARKLLVRDRILTELSPLLADCGTAAEAQAILLEALPDLAAAAEEVLREAGCTDAVTASLAVEAFPTRDYEGFSLPAGRYTALRLVIGDGGGHNWWCVAFPPLCLEAVSGGGELTAMGLSPDAAALMTGGYTLRFRCVELAERLRS